MGMDVTTDRMQQSRGPSWRARRRVTARQGRSIPRSGHWSLGPSLRSRRCRWTGAHGFCHLDVVPKMKPKPEGAQCKDLRARSGCRSCYQLCQRLDSAQRINSCIWMKLYNAGKTEHNLQAETRTKQDDNTKPCYARNNSAVYR